MKYYHVKHLEQYLEVFANIASISSVSFKKSKNVKILAPARKVMRKFR